LRGVVTDRWICHPMYLVLVLSRADREAYGSSKLRKAAQFLEVADVALSCHLYDPCVSLAVSAAINASDALCIQILGDYSRGENHESAMDFLRRCGQPGQAVSRQLAPILQLKNIAQYSTKSCTQRDADNAYRRAKKIYDTVELVIGIGAGNE
jgi:HEPN domain-containing protein